MAYILRMVRWHGQLLCFGRLTAMRMLLEKAERNSLANLEAYFTEVQ